jgi:ribosome-associated translation inhibitor RaiA
LSPFSDEAYDLRIEVDSQHFALSEEDDQTLRDATAPLERMVAHFPEADLYITLIHHARSQEYQCKTSLVLTGTTLFTGDHSDQWYSAFVRCIRKLMSKVKAYEAKLAHEPEKEKQVKGTVYRVQPDWQPDLAKVMQAAENGDYVAFRTRLYGYDEPLRKRAGRWIEGSPELEARLGDELKLEDVVEEVMLNAFDQFSAKPQDVPLSEWLEDWIEPSVRNLLRRPAEEQENVAFARTWQETAARDRRSGPE